MFTFDPARAEQELADLVSITNALVEAWDDADSVADRLHGVWAGDAAMAHMAAHDTWRENVEVMTQALREMTQVLRDVHGNYSAAAQANTDMWG